MAKVAQLKFRAKRAHSEAKELYEWFSNNDDEPPKPFEFNIDELADLDIDIELISKEILNVESIPSKLWEPFWINHAFFGRKNFASDAEYWLAAIRNTERTLSFLGYLAKQEKDNNRNTESATSKLDQGIKAEKMPENLSQSVFRILWQLPKPLVIGAIVLVVVIGALFAVWNSFPDTKKEQMLNNIFSVNKRPPNKANQQ